MTVSRLLILIVLLSSAMELQAAKSQLAQRIRVFIENKPEGEKYKINGTPLYSSQVLPRFYAHRAFEPAWFNAQGELRKAAYAMQAYIGTVWRHGLTDKAYHSDKLNILFENYQHNAEPDTSLLTIIDLLLTDAFMLLGSHLHQGKLQAHTIEATWKIQRNAPELMLDEKLEKAISMQEVPQMLEMLAPGDSAYLLLVQKIEFFNSILDEPWETIRSEKKIEPGDSSVTILKIRKRLYSLTYHPGDTTSQQYNDELLKTIKRFQLHQGLHPDGVIGPRTLSFLNRTPEGYINTLKANIERYRWLSEFPEKRKIIVNIANFRIDFIDHGDTLFSSRAIVGKHYRKTPVFNETMTYMVLSPDWVVPPTILRVDVLPQLKKGPGYLNEKNMQIITTSGRPVSYESINWSEITARNFPYMVRQLPGAQNALGRVKFMFPNIYNVYIHDTPSRELFERESRAFSSGCIRIERPLELAELLLSDQPSWTSQRIRDVALSGRETTVRLKQGVEVYLTYFTAWARPDGVLEFREDIYQRDEDIVRGLAGVPSWL
ncbi:MAG: hypothetical protein EA392_11610 [Cryomorphaceae bacterium]|nr:MAG: hypothetical protein EA392_11610 [Cryomorphaceae bacterium]